MMHFELCLTLQSDATFGRGDGVPGLVNEEIEHDLTTGLPFLRGRTLKGLLTETCADTLYALTLMEHPHHRRFEEAAGYLFGQAGSTHASMGHLQVGNARLPQPVRDAVWATLQQEDTKLTPTDVLESLTSIRRQTAVDPLTGAPADGSLRTMRVLLRGVELIADLHVDPTPSKPLTADIKALLAILTASLKRAGIGRNRGRGRLQATLCHEGTPVNYRTQFEEGVS